MIKYVYVLICSNQDLYAEQMFLSLYSLKYRMPDAHTTVLTDSATKQYLETEKQYILPYITDIISVDIPNTYSQKQKSRFLKTTMRRNISGDFLYIDCDTVVADTLSEIEQIPYEIAGVLDTHVPLSKYYARARVVDTHNAVKMTNALHSDCHFNSGVMYVKETESSYNFFETWHRLWKECVERGVSIDQISLNEANCLCGNIIQQLDDVWNCQVLKGGLPFLTDAKIIHYFATQEYKPHPYILADTDVLSSIAVKKIVPEEVIRYIYNPKTAFSLQTKLLADTEMLDLLESKLFSDLLKLKKNKPRIFGKLMSLNKFIHSLGIRDKIYRNKENYRL